MAREIDLQRRHRHVALGNGIEVGAGTIVLALARHANPVDHAAARIHGLYRTLGTVPMPEPRRLEAAQFTKGSMRHVDVEDHGALERSLEQTLDDEPRHFGRGAVIHLPLLGATQREGHGGQSEKSTLDRRGDGARVKRIVTEVLAVVDARDHHVVLEIEEPGDREVHAVGRCTRDEVGVPLELGDAQWLLEGERVARTAVIALGRHHRELGEARECLAQGDDARRPITVIVAYEDLHRAFFLGDRRGPPIY